MKTLIPLLLLLCCLPTVNTYAQAKLEGRLTTETGQPVPFVELVPNNGQVTPTKEDGSFLIRFHDTVKPSDSTTIRVSNGWIICSQYRGRFVTVPESDKDSVQVVVAPRGSGCVLTPENFTRLMGEVFEWRVKIDLTLGQGGQPTAESVVERKLRQELAIRLAMISVLENYSEETGVPLATLQKEIDGWARSKDGKDTDLGRAAKALYLGDWSQAEVLAGVTMKNESARISELKRIGDEVKRKTVESVRAFVSGAQFKIISQNQQGKLAEALKTIDEIDEFFASQVSKEEFKEEWGLAKMMVGSVRMQVALIKFAYAHSPLPDAAASLISKAIADEEEAIRMFNEMRKPDAQAQARLMVGAILFTSKDIVQGEERARRLSRALENVDAASTLIRQPAPADCECSQEQRDQLQYLLASVYAGIGSDIGGEQGALLMRKAEVISEEGFSRSTDKASRALWAQGQGLIGGALLRPTPPESPDDVSDAKSAIGFLEKTLTRVSKEELPVEWAQIKATLATAYLKLGDAGGTESARNLDAALTSYDQASEVLAKHGPAEQWAATRFTLGFALMQAGLRAVRDDRTAKLTRAVKIFEELLKFYKGRETLYQWPWIQLNLGRSLTALGEGLPGEEGEAKLLAAAAAIEKALAGFTPSQRVEWGEAQGALAWVHLSLANNFKRDPAKHLAIAVKASDAALAALPPEAPRTVRAGVTSNLGGALLRLGQLPGQESESHLTRAVEVLKQTLLAYDGKESRQLWAGVYANLGSAFLVLGTNVERDRERNLLEAVAAYEKALTVFSEKETGEREAYSVDLGLALLALGQKVERDREAHLLKALKIFNEVSALQNEKDSPLPWAQVQSYTGQTLLTLAQTVEKERENRLARSIAAFGRALPVLTAKGPPSEAAQAEVDLGRALLTLGVSRGPAGAQPLTEAVEAFDRALAVFTGKQFERDRASAQINRGGALLNLGRLTGGEEGSRRLTDAIAAGEEARATFKVDSSPDAWAEATIIISEALLGLERTEEAAKGFAEVLSVDPDNLRAITGSNYIYHEILFNYDEAFRLQQHYMRVYPKTVEAEADYAEKHFTTKRFAECERLVSALLQDEGLDAGLKVVLRAIQIANLLALGKPESVGSKMDELIKVVIAQPPAFEVAWVFNGTTHFIGNDGRFVKYRAQLLQVFAAVKAGQRDKIIDEMRKVRAGFNE